MGQTGNINYRAWSKERPVSSGYYWCTREEDDYVFMVLVLWDEQKPEQPLVRTMCGHCNDTPMSEMDLDLLWLGPLGPTLIDTAICPDGSYMKMSSATDDEDGVPAIE